MKEGLDINLLKSGELMRKGYSFLIANLGKTIAIITLAIVVLVSFAEISFSDLGKENFTSTLVVMLICSYIMYFSLEDAGEKLGRESEEYTAAYKLYCEEKEKITGNDLPKLRKFCLEYREAELEYRRNDTLFSLGYTKDEYDRYVRGEKVDRKGRSALRRVKKIKCAELDAASLLSISHNIRSELKTPSSNRLLRTLINLIPSTICTLFTVSVIISVKDNLTASGIIEALIKISALPIIGLKGYSSGYEYAIRDEKEWLGVKTNLLKTFIVSKANV